RAVDDEGLLATDIADELVRRGMPFREAHGIVGRLLRRGDEAGVGIRELSDADWADVHPLLVEGGRSVVSAESSVEARKVPGGTSRAAVLAQLAEAAAALG